MICLHDTRTPRTLSRPTAARTDTDEPATNGIDQSRLFYYSAAWQLIQEEIDNVYTPNTGHVTDRRSQLFWGLRGADDIVHRRTSNNNDTDYTDLTDRKDWYVTDARGSVRAILAAGSPHARVQERDVYEPYGALPDHTWPGDLDGDGDVDSADQTAMNNLALAPPPVAHIGPTPITSSNYRPDADLNRDGTINSSDVSLMPAAVSALPAADISNPPTGTIYGKPGPGNPIGFGGMVYAQEAGAGLARNRWDQFDLGRWLERDPAGYADGLSLYWYGDDSPWVYGDAYGLFGEPPGGMGEAMARQGGFSSMDQAGAWYGAQGMQYEANALRDAQGMPLSENAWRLRGQMQAIAEEGERQQDRDWAYYGAHGAANALGMVPVIGAPVNLLHGLWYGVVEDRPGLGAAMAALALIPEVKPLLGRFAPELNAAIDREVARAGERVGELFAPGNLRSGALFPDRSAAAVKSASSASTPVKNFDVVGYRPTNPGFQNHHGVLDVWASHNIPGYLSRGADSPAIALTRPQHSATQAIFRDWAKEMTGKPVGGQVDWSAVSAQEVQSLSERVFDAAGVPAAQRAEYYNQFYRYIYGGK